MKFYSSMRTLLVTNNAKGQQQEITLKLRLHILLMCCFFYYYVRRSVLFKIHAANIDVFYFVDDGKLFLKISQMLCSSMYMLVVCICYCYNFHVFFSFSTESTILIQRDVLWTGKI